MNLKLFEMINGLANKNVFLNDFMIFFSKYVPYIFMISIVVIFFLGIKKEKIEYKKIAVNTVITTVISLIFSFIIGKIYYVNRPFVKNSVNLLYDHAKDASFPSDHATGTMGIALGIGKYNKIISRISIFLSIMVGISRVYVGHHYPADIIGAYVLVFLVNYIYNLKLRTKVENLYEIIENDFKYVVEKYRSCK